MMKMAVVSEISLLLLFCCSVICPTESLADCNRHAATGEAFAVPLGYSLQDTDRVRWRRGSDVIVERRPAKTGKKYTFLIGSDNDIYPNGSLKLMNVNISHVAEYIPIVYKANGESVPNLEPTRLCVLDRVTQPTLKIECLKTQVVLTCQVAKVKDLNFSWLHNNKELKDSGEKLELKLKSLEQGKHSFSCRVYNQVSTLTSKTVPSNCNNFFFTDVWTLIYICVGGGGGLVLILTIIVIVCCVRAKRKKRMQKTDEEELRLRWANPEQRQQNECPHHGHPPNHQHQRQQQPAGHTGPRQHRSKQHREQQHRPRAQEPPPPQPGPRRATQASKAEVNGDDEKPPPLPQPRTKTPRTKQV